MMDIDRVHFILQSVRPDLLNASFAGLAALGSSTFRLTCSRRSFFVKWIEAADQLGHNEASLPENPAIRWTLPVPRFEGAYPFGDDILALWEYVEGDNLSTIYRHLLPQAFKKLGQFHHANRNRDPVQSQVTRRVHPTVPALVEAEVAFLSTCHPSPARILNSPMIRLLSQGYATRIHGDVHPGNILHNRGRLSFTDWAYSINSLNLFDLGYIHSTELIFNPAFPPPWIILPKEAESILPVYFSACSMANLDIKPTHWAIMLWTELWSLHNSLENDDPGGQTICLQNIDRLLSLQSDALG